MPHICPEEGPCETCAITARREAMWESGPPRKSGATTTTVETEGGTFRAPATIDPATQRAIAAERAGLEYDAESGQWRGGFYPVDDV